ncbi:restriction endonuclease subunit S [Desulfococcaceae bacterium HSG9]|nr:restriction endonuclease subunit S [Desulfococcaceae bacterium HSG9]
MKKNLTQLIENKIDRTKWQKWKFSDLVENIVNKVVPKESGLKHYIGLGHLDSGSLKIRRFGETSTLIGDKLKIYKGDLIFAKRNAYLKRVAIAEFDAVVSAHSLVLRPKPDNVLPEFLPFFLLSEKFWERAIEISVGSLSPTINWRVIAKQEFLLPPKDRQAQLAELLWAMDEVIEKELGVLEKLEMLYQRIAADFFRKDSRKFETKVLGDLVSIKSGVSPSKFNFVQKKAGIPYYKVKDLNESIKFQYYAKEWVEEVPNNVIFPESVIFPKRGAAIMTNKVRIVIENCHIDTNTMALKIRDQKLLNNEFLYYFLLYKELFRIADVAQIPQINNKHINPYPINLPPIVIQLEFVKELNQVVETIELNKSKLMSSKSLQKSLINQVF